MRQNLKRLLACLTLTALLVGAMPAQAAAASGFQDVPRNHWAAESIQRCVSLGFFQGKGGGRFGLGEQMTRSAFAVVLCRFFGWETPKPETATFPDVPVTAWYAGSVEAAYTHGAVTDQRENFRPNDPITREELAVMLVRALGYGTLAGLVQELGMPFQDVTTNAGYITMAYDLGLINGTSGITFSPEQTAPREQVAVILVRLYDKLRAKSPEKLAVVSAPESGEALPDLKGLDAAAFVGGRLIGVGGKASISNALDDASAARLREAAHQVGAKALLHITGGTSAVDASISETAALLVQAVKAGGYDGLFLDVPELKREKRRGMTQLVNALNAQLGDLPLYVVIEAPAWEGKTYDGYDYDALIAASDHLVLRVAAYENSSKVFPTAPVEPLEEVYYALDFFQDEVSAEKLTLMLDTGVSLWSASGRPLEMEPEAAEAVLAAGKQLYSDRYACAYLTGEDEDREPVVAWYLNSQAVQSRAQLAKVFGVGQLCLSDWNARTQAFLPDMK